MKKYPAKNPPLEACPRDSLMLLLGKKESRISLSVDMRVVFQPVAK